jgi:hypothetical protein
MSARLPVFGREDSRRWTDDDDAVLLAEPDNAAAAQQLDRTPYACKRRSMKLRKRGDVPAPAPVVEWSAEEDALIGGLLPVAEVCRRTGLDSDAVINRRRAIMSARGRVSA